MNIAYGYTIEPFKRDHLVHITNLCLDQFAKAATPGTWMVDIVPACEFHDYPGEAKDSKADTSSETYPCLVPRGRLQTHSSSVEGAIDRDSGQTLCVRESTYG